MIAFLLSLLEGKADSPSRPLCLLFLTSLFALAPCLASAQPAASLDLQLAREPAVITTTAKREYTGLLDGFRDGRLFIRNATGGGEVGYSFAPAEIEKLKLPGGELDAQAAELVDRGELATALPLLEALGRQRLRYLPVLNPAHLESLRLLVSVSSRVGNPLATIGYVNQLRLLLTSPDERALLRDAELGAHVQLDHKDEIRRLASAWCAEADPAGDSALGWKILAQLAYDESDFEKARRTALEPIVFSAYLPMADLDRCYALAISAARKLNDHDHALILEHEAQERGLAVAPVAARSSK